MFHLLRSRYRNNATSTLQSVSFRNTDTPSVQFNCFRVNIEDESVSTPVVPIDTENSLFNRRIEEPEINLEVEESAAVNNSGYLETFINNLYYVGLSCFKLSKAGETTSSWISKGAFMLFNLLALTPVFLNVKYFRATARDDEDKKFWYVLTGFQTTVGVLQATYFKLMWTGADLFAGFIKKVQTTNLSNTHFSSWGKTAMRIFQFVSMLAPTIYLVAGLDIWSRLDNWSFDNILKVNEMDIKQLIWPSSTADGDANNPTNVTESVLPSFEIDAWIFGTTNLLLKVLGTILESCSIDLFLLITIKVWTCTKELKIKVPRNFLACQSASILSCDEAEKIINMHDDLRLVCLAANDVLEDVLPAIGPYSIILTSHFIHVWLRGKDWIYVIFLFPKLLKILVTYRLAMDMDISKYKHRFNCWLHSLHGIVGLDKNKVESKMRLENLCPVGIGESIFYIDNRFMASFCGIVLTYFLIIAEAIDGGKK